MNKTSAIVLALFLGNSKAIRFAEGLEGDEALNETIYMRGDNNQTTFAQPENSTAFGQPENATAFGQPNATALGQPENATTLAEPQNATSFGQPENATAFGQPENATSFGQPENATSFGQPENATAFGQPENATTFAEPQNATLISLEDDKSSVHIPEKVVTVQPIPYNDLYNNDKAFAFPNQRTQFYVQLNKGNIPDDLSEPEQVSVLDPKISRGRTTFNAQVTAPDLAEPEKVETLDPKIAKVHTTFYDKQNGVWREAVAQKDAPITADNRNAWVYEFSRDNLPPYDSSIRADGPEGLVQKRNIGEVGVDETVYGFVRSVVPPLQKKAPETEPYLPNGHAGWGSVENSKPIVASLLQQNKKNIGEVGVDETVYGFVRSVVPPIQKRAPETEPYLPNGHAGWGSVENSKPITSLAEKQDVNNAEIRPDVYDVVSKNVPAWSYWRSGVPPEKREDGMFNYSNNTATGRNPDPSFAQLEPEKVVTLQPQAYKNRANTNTPNQRTTFYDKKNGLWREEF